MQLVVVGVQDNDLAMALRSSSLISWSWAARLLSLCNGFCLRAGGRTVSRIVERIRR